jgi:predicted DNA-binding protein (UPF0251 family)
MRGRPVSEGCLMSQQDAASILGISRRNIQDAEASAIRKIRLAILEDPEIREYAKEVCGDAVIELALSKI